jgi:hypothetical protein
MNDKLQEIKTDLAVNGKQTKEKKMVYFLRFQLFLQNQQ